MAGCWSAGLMRFAVLFITLLSSLSFPASRYRKFRVTSSYTSAEMTANGKEDDSSTLSERISRALGMHKNGLLDEAIAVYESVLPDLTGKLASTLHSNVGAIYMNKGDNDLARKHFEQAVETEPLNSQSHFNLAVLLTSKFEAHGKAIYHCGTALKIDPTMYKALHLMGNILQNIGKDADAQKYFIMAESLAREQSLQAESAITIEGNNDRAANAEGKNNWGRFTIMGAKEGDEFAITSLSSSVSDSMDGKSAEYQVICISERPLIFKIPKFMTDEEGEHIVRRAAGRLKRSFVMGGQTPLVEKSDIVEDSNSVGSKYVDDVNGEGGPDDKSYRSSSNAWLHPDELATCLQRRLADLTGFPLQLFRHKSEELQVVKYDSGGQFKVHHDSSAFSPRLLTALLYLNTVPESSGGETWFPFAGKRRQFDLSVEEAISAALEMHVSASNRSETKSLQNGLFIRPEQGDAIIFFNHLQSGTIDSAAVHAGLPVLSSEGAEGQGIEKWIANYWVEQDFNMLFDEKE